MRARGRRFGPLLEHSGQLRRVLSQFGVTRLNRFQLGHQCIGHVLLELAVAAAGVVRLDLVEAAAPLPELFVDEPGKTLADYRP